jgi:hypothetical protein
MSTEEELNALAALTFNWTRALDDVWGRARYHVEGLHAETAELILRGIAEAGADGANPLGIVIQGQRGVEDPPARLDQGAGPASGRLLLPGGGPLSQGVLGGSARRRRRAAAAAA